MPNKAKPVFNAVLAEVITITNRMYLIAGTLHQIDFPESEQHRRWQMARQMEASADEMLHISKSLGEIGDLFDD